jgi:DNA-binding CsgD family transcriptional regulator
MKTHGARDRSSYSGHTRALDFLYRLYARQPISRLVEVIFQDLPKLVDGDNVMVGIHHAECRMISSLSLIHPFSHMAFLPEANTSGLLGMHPFWTRILDPHQPLKILSEMVSDRQWRENPFNRELLAPDQVRDHLNIEFGPSATHFTTVSVIRSTRGFSREDQHMMATLQPHLAQAFLNAATAEQEVAANVPDDLCGSCQWPVGARGDLVFRHEDDRQRWTNLLALCSATEPEILAWLTDRVTALNRGIHQGHPRVLRNALITYHLEVEQNWSGRGYLLRAAKQQAYPTPALTLRERDVLRWVKNGKTNQQIAQILGISVHTTKQHLKAIFIKLGVENRTAATYARTGCEDNKR